MNFEVGQCPKCKKNKKLMFSNNPLSGTTICFECIDDSLIYDNLEHADFFCRSYNIKFDPNIWMEICNQFKGKEAFEKYTEYMIEEDGDDSNTTPQNLYYSSSTKDLWSKANHEWEKMRSFAEILDHLEPIKDSYIVRGRLKWGEQYSFEDLIKLDSIYTKTLKANSITNPLQKEAVKAICKLQLEIDDAIRCKDAKALKDFSSTYATFSKEAGLDEMIAETRTDDITTVSELYQYMEDKGFHFQFHDNFDRDEVDRTIKDLQDANRKLILESTGLQQTLEDMIKQQQQMKEEEYSEKILNGEQEAESLQDLLDFHAPEMDVDMESDDDVTNLDFNTAAQNGLDEGEEIIPLSQQRKVN